MRHNFMLCYVKGWTKTTGQAEGTLTGPEKGRGVTSTQGAADLDSGIIELNEIPP